MGAKPSPQKRQLMFSPSQFIQIKRSSISNRQTYGNFSCHQHKTTNEQVDKYRLEFASKKQLQNYYECFFQRYRQQYVVNTIEFVDLSQTQFCSHLYKAEVYIQHIPVRLGNITDIPYPDNLYILKNCLIGFAGLYSMVGFFQVNQDHICVNSYGEVKVWFNTDLSKNYPQDENQQIKSQCDMVNKIIRIIEEDTNTQQLPIQFSEYLSMKNKKFPKFSEAIQLLNQYIEQYKPKVPKYCQSIFQLFKDSQQESKVSLKQMMAEGQKERERPSQTGSIIINQIVVPRLDISRVGDQNRRESNVVQSQQLREERGEQDKDRTNLRQTIKIEQNLYGGFSFGRIENIQNERIPTQKTQRIGQRYSKQMQEHRRLASHNKSMIQNYNRLSTKRTPATDIKNSIKSQFTVAPIPPFVSTTRSVKPIVHFSYLPPSIHNSQILFGPQPLNQIRTSFIRSSNSNIQQMENFKIKFPELRVEGVNQIRSRAVSMNTSASPKWGTHDMSKKQQKHEIINMGQKIQKEQKKQKKQQRIKGNKKNKVTEQSSQNKERNREQNHKQKQKQKIDEIDDINHKQKQETMIKLDEVAAKVEVDRCFYLTETGSEQIDPEIAADLLKYL